MNDDIRMDDRTRNHVLQAVAQVQAAHKGKWARILDIVDLLTSQQHPRDVAQATNVWSLTAMDLASPRCGYLRFDIPALYKLTRKGWEEGMNRDPKEFPWPDDEEGKATP